MSSKPFEIQRKVTANNWVAWETLNKFSTEAEARNALADSEKYSLNETHRIVQVVVRTESTS